MGNCSCGQKQFAMPSVQDRMVYKYAEDPKYGEFEHRDRIRCNSDDISLLQNLQSCEEKLRHSRKLFKDDNMPLESVIIVDSQNPESKNQCSLERPFQIIDDLSEQKYQVFNPKHPPKISDIIYNRSGLEYVGVFLCFLADHPYLIEDVILTSKNTYGIYAISMIIDGEKKSIYIDDRIMCKKKKPLFVHPIAGKYIWPILLEKAWLKIKGIQVNSIDKHNYMSVFNSFLNLPIKHYKLQEETQLNKDEHQNIRAKNEELLEKNLKNLKHYHGCIVTTRKQPQHKLGIPKQTNLYLIKCFQYNKQTLFLLRNTNQSMGEFRGEHRMSTISQQLMNQVFKHTKTQVTVDGNFILTKSEFLEQIQTFSIIYYEQEASQVVEKIVPLKAEQDYFTSFTLHGDSLVNICLKQTIIGDSNPLYSPISYNIIRLSKDEIISKQTNNDSSNGVQMNYLLDGTFQNLQAGKYLIRLKKKTPKVFGKGKSVDKLLIFAKNRATFEAQDQIQQSNDFKALLTRLGQAQLQQKKILQIISFKHECQTVHYWLGDLVVIYVQKNSMSKDCKKAQIDFSQMKNLRSVSHPEIRAQLSAIQFSQDSLTIVFEKISLSQETVLGHYIVQPF